MDFQIKDMPSFQVACIRHIGPYKQIGEAFERLFRWAGPKGLFTERTFVLGVYRDDPYVTPPERLRSEKNASRR